MSSSIDDTAWGKSVTALLIVYSFAISTYVFAYPGVFERCNFQFCNAEFNTMSLWAISAFGVILTQVVILIGIKFSLRERLIVCTALPVELFFFAGEHVWLLN